MHRIGQIEYLPAELHAERFTDGEVAHQSKVQDVGVWAAKRIAADIAEEAWVLQLVGISQIGLQRPARTVLGNIIPAIHVPNDRWRSDTVWSSSDRAENVQGAGDASAGADGKWPAAGKGVNAGGLEAAHDVGKSTTVYHLAVAAEGQLIDITDRQAVRAIEIAGAKPRTVIATVGRAAGIGFKLLGSVVHAAGIGVGETHSQAVAETALEARFKPVVLSHANG